MSEAGAAVARPRSIGPKTDDLIIGASAIALALLALLAWTALNLWIEAALLLLAAALALAAALLPAIRSTLRLHSIAVALSVPLAASALVALAASRSPPFDSYWGWLALWLGALVAVPIILGHERLPAIPRLLSENRAEVAGVVALTVVAFAVRAYKLGSLPSPFSGDEASFTIRGIHGLEGDLRNMFQSGIHGTPNLYFFFVAAFQKLLGVTVEGARAGSVLLGVLAVPATYLFIRQLFGKLAAMAGTALLTFYHFHNQFSRQAMLNISDTLLLPLLFLFAYRTARNGKAFDYGMTGLLLGISLYGWASVRIVPFILAGFWGWSMITRRSWLPNLGPGLAVMAVTAIVAAAPLGWWWLHNMNEFNTRFNQVGIHQRDVPAAKTWFEGERERGRSAFDIYKGQVEDVLKATFLERETAAFYRSPVPLVDNWVLPLFVVGFLLCVVHFVDARCLLLLMMLGAPLAGGGVLTEPPVSAARLVGIITPVAAMVGVAAAWMAQKLARNREHLMAPLAVAAIVPAIAFSLSFYFGRYASGDYYSDDVTRIVEAHAATVRKHVEPGSTVYWFVGDDVAWGHPALNFGLRDYYVKSVTPEGKAGAYQNLFHLQEDSTRVAYIFAGRRAADAAAFAANCPGGTMIESVKPDTRALDIRIYRQDRDCLRPRAAKGSLDATHGRAIDGRQ